MKYLMLKNKTTGETEVWLTKSKQEPILNKICNELSIEVYNE